MMVTDRGLGLPLMWDESSFTLGELKMLRRLPLHYRFVWRGESVEVSNLSPLQVSTLDR